MADLSLSRPKSSNRAQLLLVGAFALAVTFVALALVVNSAIYTENLATRGTVPGSGEALEQRHEVEQSVGTVLEYANWHNHTNPESSVQGSIENISQDQIRQEILWSRAVDVSYKDFEDGHKIVQKNNSDREFRNETGNQDWVLAENIDETRRFKIRITNPGSLASSKSSAFIVSANESISNSWEMAVWDDSGNLAVEVNSSGETARCNRNVNTDNATIDITNGLISDEPCAALMKLTNDGSVMSFANGLSGYDIVFENGGEIAGNYSLVIGSKSANWNSLKDATSDTTPPSNVPYYTNAIYSVTVEYAYQTSDVAYETEIEVAPGEPR